MQRRTDGTGHFVRSLLLRKSLFPLVIGALLVAMLSSVLLSLSFSQPRRAHADVATQRPSMGLNAVPVFADVMKSGRPYWYDTNYKDTAPVDDQGWPTTDAANVIWEGTTHNDGTYRMSFNGQADVSDQFSYGQYSDQHYDPATNTTTLTMVVTDTGAENFLLTFKNTKRTATSATNTGITNVQLMRPISEGSTTSYDPSVAFTTESEAAAAPYTYLRFMDGTNWNTSVNWSDRTRPLEFNQNKTLTGEFAGNQIALEYEIRFANETNKDLYICVPARANNDYLTKMAQTILYGSDGVNPYTSPQANPAWAPLKSNLKLYVEYANEAWNFSFQPAHDLYDGPVGYQQEIKNNPNSPLVYDGATDGNLLWHRNYAYRAVNISKVLRTVFGDAAMSTRVRPLLYWQYNNLNNTAEDELIFVNDYYNNADGIQHVADPHPVSYYFWGGGGAVYFNSNNDSATSIDALFASGIPQDSYQNMMNVEALWARLYGLHFMAYEGSWGIINDVGTPARLDPRAKQALIDSFNAFTRAGGENYTAGTWSQWDNIKTALNAPLVQGAAAVNDASFTPAPIAQGLLVSEINPTIINGAHYSMTRAGLSGASTNLGNETGYLLHVTSSNTYQIALNVNNTSTGGKIGVYVDGELLSTVDVPVAAQTVIAGTTALSTGLHSIMLRASAQPGGGNAGTVNALLIQPGTGTPPALPTPGGLPAGWQDQDIGSVGQAGSASLTNGTLSITASGADISGTSDAFNFVYQQVTGDATIIARTTWLGDSNSYAKVGVMIRSSLNANAANAITYYSPSGDTTFQERTTDGGNTSHGTPPQLDPPTWLKLVRSGSTITGYISHDGSNWTQQGSDTFTLPQVVYVGLAVDAHNNNVLLTGDLDNISLNGTPFGPGATPTPSPTSSASGWTRCADENSTCTFSGTMIVRYGANGSYAYQTATDSIACNNATFGDPIVGTFKACYVAPVPPTGWTRCAAENSTCTASGTFTVAYGANGKFYYKTFSNSISCNNATFGDPIVGTFKACYYL